MSGRLISTPTNEHRCLPGCRIEHHEYTEGNSFIPSLPTGDYIKDDGAPNGSAWVCDESGKVWIRDLDLSDARTKCLVFNWRPETRREHRRRLRAHRAASVGRSRAARVRLGAS